MAATPHAARRHVAHPLPPDCLRLIPPQVKNYTHGRQSRYTYIIIYIDISSCKIIMPVHAAAGAAAVMRLSLRAAISTSLSLA